MPNSAPKKSFYKQILYLTGIIPSVLSFSSFEVIKLVLIVFVLPSVWSDFSVKVSVHLFIRCNRQTKKNPNNSGCALSEKTHETKWNAMLKVVFGRDGSLSILFSFSCRTLLIIQQDWVLLVWDYQRGYKSNFILHNNKIKFYVLRVRINLNQGMSVNYKGRCPQDGSLMNTKCIDGDKSRI